MSDGIYNIGMQGGFGGGLGTAPRGSMFRRNYKHSDQSIEKDVVMRVRAHHDVSPDSIQIHVKDGIVTMTGTVLSSKIKDFIETEAAYVAGVQDVKSDLNVVEASP